VTLGIISVTPAYGIATQDVTIEILGQDFNPSSHVRMVTPSDPPVLFPLTGVIYLSPGILHVLVPAGALPIGIYDITVDNGNNVTANLPQVYRADVELIDPYGSQTLPVLQDRVRSRFHDAPNGKPYDLRVGSVISDMVDAPLPEFEILYNRLGRVLKQGFAQYMGGAYLDLRCEEHGVLRKPATYATGIIQTIAPVGTVLPINMTFSTTTQPNVGQPAVRFTSTEIATKIQKAIVGGVVTSATPSTLTDTHLNLVTNEWSGGYVWINAGTAKGQARKILSNTQTTITVNPWDTGILPDVTSGYEFFSGVDIIADLPGSSGNVAAGAVNIMTSRTLFITGITNPVDIGGGFSAESDAQLLSRFLLTVRSPSSGGNVADYKRWAREAPNTSIGDVSVVPLWQGNGTVQVVIMNADGTIPNTATINAVQQFIDPNAAGMGGGVAPIGAKVTVQAAATVAVDVSVKLFITPGYNATSVINEVAAAISNYLFELAVGDDVIFTQVQHEILYDPAEPAYYRAGVQDYDILSAGYGIKLSSSGTWTQANIVIPGNQTVIPGTITVTT